MIDDYQEIRNIINSGKTFETEWCGDETGFIGWFYDYIQLDPRILNINWFSGYVTVSLKNIS